jgi:hypothetical protein
MRIVEHTSRFTRDYKREKSGRHSKRLDAELMAAVTMLVKDEPLPRRSFTLQRRDFSVMKSIFSAAFAPHGRSPDIPGCLRAAVR